MSRSPADILRSARIARGFASAAEAARHFGWKEAAYTHHENGTRGIRPEAARRYARAFGLDEGSLLGLTLGGVHIAADQGVPVVGTAAWGVWRDRSVMESSKTTEAINVPRGARLPQRMAVLIDDASIDKAIPRGFYAIYEPLPSDGLHSVQSGKFLVIRRQRDGLEELTVRRILGAVDGEVKLSSHSTSGQFRDVITIAPGSDIEVLGVVVGQYAPM